MVTSRSQPVGNIHLCPKCSGDVDRQFFGNMHSQVIFTLGRNNIHHFSTFGRKSSRITYLTAHLGVKRRYGKD